VLSHASHTHIGRYFRVVTLKIALIAATSLLLVAFLPHKNDAKTIETMRRARRALMKGIVRSVCPECYEIADDDGLITRVEVAPLTLVAGAPEEGDRVDILAEFTGARYVAVSVVKTA
jgi:hypothetical protein